MDQYPDGQSPWQALRDLRRGRGEAGPSQYTSYRDMGQYPDGQSSWQALRDLRRGRGGSYSLFIHNINNTKY